VSTRLIGWPAAVLATLFAVALVAGEITDSGQRRWWATHALTTDTVSGLLVLLITVLVVNQLLSRRQASQRGHAVASQAAIVVAQAARSAQALSAAINGSGDLEAASDSFRTYTLMLLISAPVLIDDPVARNFLEQAQYLTGVMARTLTWTAKPSRGAAVPSGTLDDAVQRLETASTPLLQLITPEMRDAIQRLSQTAGDAGD
jgi:hypothetical protein